MRKELLEYPSLSSSKHGIVKDYTYQNHPEVEVFKVSFYVTYLPILFFKIEFLR